VGWLVCHTWKIDNKWYTNCLNYCKIFILYTEFTNVASGRIIQPGKPHPRAVGLETHALTGSSIHYTNSSWCTVAAFDLFRSPWDGGAVKCHLPEGRGSRLVTRRESLTPYINSTLLSHVCYTTQFYCTVWVCQATALIPWWMRHHPNVCYD